MRKTKGIALSEMHGNKLVHWWLAKASAKEQREFLRLNGERIPEEVRKIADRYELP